MTCKNCIKADVCMLKSTVEKEVAKYGCHKFVQALLPCVQEIPETKPKVENLKRNWENGFQRWSNKQGQDGTTSYGVCGYGSMCDYCEDNTHGRPCVRALNEMCRDKYIIIDYTDRNFEDIWNGEFKRSDTNDR